MKTFPLIAALAALALTPPARHAQAQTYKFKTIDYKNKYSTLLQDLNLSGTIVGNYIDNKGYENCFTVVGKTKTLVSDPGAKATACFSINAGGTIVGYTASNKPLGGEAYTYSGGSFTRLKPPGSTGGAIAYGVSDSGTIVGTYIDAGGAQHGFLLSGKTYTSFDVSGQVETLGIGVNDSGQYTVQTGDSNGNEHSFLYTAGAYQELLFPNAESTRAHQINNAGQVALGWLDSSGNEHGGVYDSASNTYYTVDVPGAVLTGIEGIDDKQTLVGLFVTPTGDVYEGFKAIGQLTE